MTTTTKKKADVPTTADKSKQLVLKPTDVLDDEGKCIFKPQTMDELNALFTLTAQVGVKDERFAEAAVRVEPSNKQQAQLKKTDKFGQKIGDKVATDENGPILIYLGCEKKNAWVMKSQHPDEKGVLRVVRTSDIHQIRYSAAKHKAERKSSGGGKRKRKVIEAGIGKIG
jgi:hypothetical protein